MKGYGYYSYDKIWFFPFNWKKSEFLKVFPIQQKNF